MASSMSLDLRGRDVLYEIVRAYVSSGEPVSSRTLARGRRFQLSSASIRNVMADLEDDGFLAQPHTSAGRVPTDLGYRYFVDVLMQPEEISTRDRREVEGTLDTVIPDQTPFFQAASRVLSAVSNQVAVVLAPTPTTAVVRSVHFVRVGEKRFLAVLVTDQGLVDHRLVTHETDHSQAELDRLARVISEDFGGVSLFQMRERVLEAMAATKRQYEAELARLLPLAERALEQEAQATDGAVFVDGTARILEKPDFSDLDKMRRIFEAFEDKARLASLLSGCLRAPGSRVLIGSEDPFTEGMDLSVVATGFGADGHGRGGIGIVGPRRLDYARLVPLVEYLGRYLEARMAGSGPTSG